MNGADLGLARALWARLKSCAFADGDLESLLLALVDKWEPGTLPAELSRALLVEAESGDPDPDPAALVLADLEQLPKTTRIDGVLPLAIPAPVDARWMSDQLIDEAARLKLGGAPDDRRRLGDELALAHLSLMHRRPITSTHRLELLATLASPGPALMLLGKLPLGGTVSLFTSSLPTAERCLVERAAVEHHSRFKLRRTGSGELRLAAGRPRPRRRKDKWTFRL